jgi:hypothetical protein
LRAQPAPTTSAADAGRLRAEVRAVTVLDPGLVAMFAQAGGVSIGQPGTGLVILLQSGSESIVGFDESKSRIEIFRDDKGRDLTAAPKPPRGQTEAPPRFELPESARFSPFATFTPDGKLGVIQLVAPSAPTSGATRLTLKAALRVTVATAQERADAQNAPLRKGALKIEGADASIEDVGTPQLGFEGGNRFAVRIATRGATTTRLARVEFLDPAGKPIESKVTGHTQNNDNRTTEYVLPEQLTAATIRFVLWKDLRGVDVPLETTVTLGVTPEAK